MDFKKLVFEEKFEIDGKPNPQNWTHEVGPKWSNNELQCYTDSLENCFVKKGILTIKATIGNDEHHYHSARIVTREKHAWTYGRFIVRAKLPKGVGAWPAIWFMPEDSSKGVPWPLCGEIDLMEQVGRDQETVHFSLHTKTYNHRKNNHRTFFETIQGVTEHFHDYEMIWTPQKISFFIDGIQKAEFFKMENDTVNEWPFDKPYYLIANIAVGGTWGGPVVDTDLPYRMEIQSIKVYQ